MKTIYDNAVVYTGDGTFAQAFVTENGCFTYVGSNEGALALWQEGDGRVDLAGAFVCPGFNDSHMHLLNYGQSLRIAPLHRHTHSLADLLQCLRNHRNTQGLRGGWLMGRGWNQDYFTDAHRMPTRHDLDRVAEDIPICAVRACGHALVLNTKALDLLNITSATPQPDGGQIVMEEGRPNGILFDNARDLVYPAIPAPSTEELKDMIRRACASLNAYGVTSCQSDDYCVFPNVSWRQINEAFRELEETGELTVRVYEQSNFTTLDALRDFVEAGNNTGTGTDFFRIGPLKMLGDGALGARTAYLSRPYADAPQTRGLSVFTQEEFDTMIGYANAHNMQVAVHAIGDGCLDMVLSALEKALTAHPRLDHRHGIVHCQITRPDQLEQMAGMGLHIYAQSIFLDYDIHIVEARAGCELSSSSYCWKTLMDKGCTVSNGTDCPVELPDALAGIQCAVTRSTLDGSCGPYLPGQAFSLRKALDSYTSAGARASFEEDRKGRIHPGMLADFTVLGQNPFETDAAEIKNIPVLATYLGGTPVYRMG